MAQIITVDLGKHNADIHKTNARLTAQGSWKKQRVIQIIPASHQVAAKVYVTHMGLIKPPNQAFVPMLVEGAEVGAAYDEAIATILSNPELSTWEFILFIEHDNIPPQDGLIKLIAHAEAHPEFHVFSGLYFLKGEGGCAQIWGDIKDPVVNYRPALPDPNGGLVECYGTGQGFAIARMSMFRELKEKGIARPWFKTVCEAGVGVGTQDLFFAKLARQHGYRFCVACDVPVGHLDINTGFVW